MIRLRTLAIAALASAGLAGCTDGYGYSGVSLGYSSPGYYGDYYDGGYGYGGYGSSYYGWYGDYYYPGTGYYVYDRYQRPHRWSDSQRHYWERRRNEWRGDRRDMRNNWDGWRGSDRRNDGRWNGNRDFTSQQREQWRQRNGSGEGTNVPRSREQSRQQRTYTPEQQEQWRNTRGQSATPRSSGTSDMRGGWRGRRGRN